MKNFNVYFNFVETAGDWLAQQDMTGPNVLVNRRWFECLTIREQQFILSHEAGHVIVRRLLRHN